MADFNPGTAMPSSASPGHSSPDSFDVEDESTQAQSNWQQSKTSPSSSTQPPRPPPLQKRRRVTRACDECRRKKIKCDGKQPCTHCTVYSYECTYDQPSNRRRNPAPQYIEALENRVARAEAILRTVMPNVDLNDPNIDALIQRGPVSNGGNASNGNFTVKIEGDLSSDSDSQLRSMIESTGQLDLDERGNWDFHGGSSGTVFIRRMREQFGNLLGDHGAPLFPRIPRPNMTPLYESPKSSAESPYENGLPNTVDLPTRETTKALCEAALSSACALLRFVHHPTFYEMVDRIYDKPPDTFGDVENRYLALLYSVLALGCMFHTELNEDPSGPIQTTYKAGIDQGLKYFRISRSMMDVTDCRDITLLQAILFMILFLQSSANLSTCYSYIGIALRSALRMGLHRTFAGNFNPIEQETRRRVFWVIRKMDTYVSALLGFPHMLSNDDIDQELPLEVDDEYITKDAVLSMPPGKPSLRMAATNAHTRLMFTLSKVIKYIYPTKGLEGSSQGSLKSSYFISHVKIREIERDLTQWLDKLPMALRPGGDGDPEVLRSQQLLRLSYAHVQMMLYRPFLHYVSRKACASKTIDERSFACAAACVSVSRNIVHITTEMKRRGLLVGAYWFTMYTTFFAILSLVYFVLENPDESGSQEILMDSNAGFEALKGLAHRSQAADRCSIALKNLFEQLPERLKDMNLNPSNGNKKRSAPSPSISAAQGMQSSSELALPGPGINPPLSRRATTFPVAPPIQTNNLQRNSRQVNRMSNPNLRQSFLPPNDLSTSGTPDSSNTNPSNIQQGFGNLPQHFGINNAVPELSAMMFPSADPFAYPNQPMIGFESVKQESIGLLSNSQSQGPPMFLSNGNASGGGRMYDDIEGQIFGPLPSYLNQGQSSFDLHGSVPHGGGMMAQDIGFHTGITPNEELTTGNFDIFGAEGDGWGNMLGDQRFRQ